MDNVQQITQSAGSGKMLRAMVGIGVLCAVLIVSMYEGTKPRIARLKSEALQNAIVEVIPGTVTTKAYTLTNEGTFAESTVKDHPTLYVGYNAVKQLVGIAIEARGQGYADIISMLYGYNPHTDAIIGFYVLESKETPGLGDKIMKDEGFLGNFKALDVSLTPDGTAIQNKIITVKHGEKENPWEIDGITGATISSRAVGESLGSNTALIIPLIHENMDIFLNKE